MIRDDSRVILHVTIRVDGELVHTTTNDNPLDYVIGSGGLAPGLESALLGMDAGDKKTATVPPEEAFGQHDPNAMQQVPKSAFENMESISVGDAIRGTHQGQQFTAFIREIEGEVVTLDLNHPLAGKTVDFEVEILEVPSAA